MACGRTDPCCSTPPPDFRTSGGHASLLIGLPGARSHSCRSGGERTSEQPSCCSSSASSAERAASALKKRGATLWPLVKALIRESPRDTDHKKITTDCNTTLRSKIDRKNHDGHRAISDQLPARRGRWDHGSRIRRRLLSELSRPVWKSTSASVNLHAIEQRLPSSRRR